MTGLTSKRKAIGWSQRRLSAESGVLQPIISDIENGKTKSPTVETAMKLAKALGCTVEELVAENKDDPGGNNGFRIHTDTSREAGEQEDLKDAENNG